VGGDRQNESTGPQAGLQDEFAVELELSHFLSDLRELGVSISDINHLGALEAPVPSEVRLARARPVNSAQYLVGDGSGAPAGLRAATWFDDVTGRHMR
jgi:hypothetical protein